MTPMTAPAFAEKNKMNLANQPGPKSLSDEHCNESAFLTGWRGASSGGS
jgi:hypothetical protein